MPVNIDSTASLNKNASRCYERNRSVNELIKAFSGTAFNTNETLRYNLTENAKRIESDLYEMAETENEYSHLVSEKIEDIQNKMNEKTEEIKGKDDSSRTAMYRDSQGWRFFFSQTLRRAVVNAFIEDVCKRVEVPLRYTFGLRIGVEQIENFAFKAGGNKVEYFNILEWKKGEITSELNSYFEGDY